MTLVMGKKSGLNEREALAADIARVENRLNEGIVGEPGNIGDDFFGDLARGSRSFNIASAFSEIASAEGAHFVHLKTPLRTDTHSEMFHIAFSGYQYSPSGEAISSIVTGYCYAAGSEIVSNGFSGSHEPTDGALNPIPSAYISSDGFVCVRIKVDSAYFLTVVADAMRVGNGRLLRREDVQLIVSKEEAL